MIEPPDVLEMRMPYEQYMTAQQMCWLDAAPRRRWSHWPSGVFFAHRLARYGRNVLPPEPTP